VLFVCSIISLAALIADVILAIKGNIPLNKEINSWTFSNYPANWDEYRSKWFRIYNTRQSINIIGFTTLVAGFVFGM
jgi:hypothetical protein